MKFTSFRIPRALQALYIRRVTMNGVQLLNLGK